MAESRHSLRRELFFAHDCAVRRRHPEQQTEQALCLSLVVNAIIAWNTAYLELALEYLAARRGVTGAGSTRTCSPTSRRRYRPLRERAS